jgi:DNA-binding response OmpR family regulator
MKKILIIDDEKNILKTVSTYLEGHSYTVLSASEGLAGIKIAEEQKPDLILLDLILPDINGYLVCEALKENALTWMIPIVAMSAKSNQSDIDLVIKNGAVDYILKPFEPKVLIEVVKRVLKEEA